MVSDLWVSSPELYDEGEEDDDNQEDEVVITITLSLEPPSTEVAALLRHKRWYVVALQHDDHMSSPSLSLSYDNGRVSFNPTKSKLLQLRTTVTSSGGGGSLEVWCIATTQEERREVEEVVARFGPISIQHQLSSTTTTTADKRKEEEEAVGTVEKAMEHLKLA